MSAFTSDDNIGRDYLLNDDDVPLRRLRRPKFTSAVQRSHSNVATHNIQPKPLYLEDKLNQCNKVFAMYDERELLNR
jgi:hypothetical protein